MNGYAALLAVLTTVAVVGLVISSLAVTVIGARLAVLASRQRMPFRQRLRYGWAGPLSMVALRAHPDEQIRRWARWLGPALGFTAAFALVVFTGVKMLGLLA